MSDKAKILILGAGESGVGAAILAQKKGFEVFVSDKGIAKDQYKQEMAEHAIPYEEGKHSEGLLNGISELIKSPGIPDTAPLVAEAIQKGIPVISEIEFAARYTNATKICITGSNGKTTTTLLTHHILKKAGLKVGLGGNVGKSFARQVALEDNNYYVLELSSFQLDNMYAFHAEIAVLLNITPDHLDRYDYDIKKYAASKFRIANNQTSSDSFIYCIDDKITMQEMPKYNITATQYPISITKELPIGAFATKDSISLNIHPENQFTMSIFELALQGKHNLYNSMAAAVGARILEVRKESIRESLSDFRNAEHRLEQVLTVHGIEFINDSKATNVNSTWYALESMNKPVVLILGGVDKGNDYEMLTPLVKEKVKGIVCLGKDNKKLHSAFGSVVEVITDADTAQEAVSKAYYMAKQGDVVLLSPACASFDLFANYEDRGRQFKEAVRGL